MLDTTYQDLNEYRLAWINPKSGNTDYGTFLFNEPKEATPTVAELKAAYPGLVIWLEDHEHNKVEI